MSRPRFRLQNCRRRRYHNFESALSSAAAAAALVIPPCCRSSRAEHVNGGGIVVADRGNKLKQQSVGSETSKRTDDCVTTDFPLLLLLLLLLLIFSPSHSLPLQIGREGTVWVTAKNLTFSSPLTQPETPSVRAHLNGLNCLCLYLFTRTDRGPLRSHQNRLTRLTVIKKLLLPSATSDSVLWTSTLTD